MLSENIKTIRRSKGLSQEALASKLNVVRQTISKWEKGLSVPDSEMLMALSEVLEAPVSVLLGETTAAAKPDDLTALAEKLESINTKIAREKSLRRRLVQGLLIVICAAIIITVAVLIVLDSPYLSWDYQVPENAVVGVLFHAFEWLFVRAAPAVLIGAMAGIFLTRKFL